jgi:O-acetylhomoserine (thiol)-lyase
MRRETMALHVGYEPDSQTKSITVPIYQTAAYAFDSAEHGAALFNLEAEGFRYSRIGNPTTSVLEQRVAALEGGVGSLCVSSGQAALHYSLLNLTSPDSNIVSVPQLYGTTHTLFSHLLPSFGVIVRFAESDQVDDIARLIDGKTKAVFCERWQSGWQCLRCGSDGERRPPAWRAVGRGQYRRHPNSASAN